jgi:hypothetical protein
MKRRAARVTFVLVLALGLFASSTVPANTHGYCAQTAAKPYWDPPYVVGFGEFHCSEGHARVAIRVNLQQQQAMFPYDWITVDTVNASNLQAKQVKAWPKWYGSDCFPRHQDRYFRTVVVYGRAFNASGNLVHEITNTYGQKELHCVG